MLPSKDKTTICFAHVAYPLQQQFALRNTGIASFQVRDYAELERRIGEADVLVISGLWRDELVEHARSCTSSSRSAPAPTSSGARRWSSAASASPARAASTPRRSPSTRWR